MSKVMCASRSTLETKFRKMSDSRSNRSFGLDQLNDDCLAHLFALLNIDDLFTLARMSKKYEEILLLFNGKFEYSVRNVSDDALPVFVKLVGRHISTLKVTIDESCDNNAVLSFAAHVQAHCSNLRHLVVRKWRHMNFDKFPHLLQRLDSLCLEECKYLERADVVNQCFTIKPWIMASPSFFPFSQAASGRSNPFTNLMNVTSLRLQHCTSVRPEHLMDYLKTNDRLVHLTLFSLSEFKSSAYNQLYYAEMGKYLQEIESFSIDIETTHCIDFLVHLPKLRSLQLINYSAPDKQIVDNVITRLRERDIIEELDLYHCHLDSNSLRTISSYSNLCTLRLSKNFWVTDQNLMLLAEMPRMQQFCCFDCILLTGEGFLHIVKMSPQLKQLDCSWCFQVTDQMIHDMVEFLQQRANRPRIRVIAGGRTKLSASILASESLWKDSKVEVKFEPTMPISCALDDNFCCNCKTNIQR